MKVKSAPFIPHFFDNQVMRRLFLMLTLLLPGFALANKQVVDARLNLKKWGLAYCIGTYLKNDRSKLDAGAARGAYFQLGSHNDELAYANVRKFFDAAMKAEQRVSKESGQPILLMNCVDAYEAPSYKKTISAQDKFLK